MQPNELLDFWKIPMSAGGFVILKCYISKVVLISFRLGLGLSDSKPRTLLNYLMIIESDR